MPPLISVIVPVYNGGRFLHAALESVLAQTYANLEILVIDDGSTDASGPIAASFPGVQLTRQAHRGVSAARNLGLSRARGTHIAFLDADDRWKPQKLQRQMEVMNRPSGPELLCTRFRNFLEPGITVPPGIPIQAFLKEKTGSMFSLCTLLAKKSHVDTIGGFNPALPYGEDLEWFARARDAGWNIPILPEILMERRLHDRNLTYSARNNKSHLIQIMRQSIHRKSKQEPRNEA